MTSFTAFAEAYFTAPTALRSPAEALAQAVSALASKIAMAAGQSPYAVLGVDPHADLATLRAAYLAKVQTLHPDRYRAAGASDATLALLSDHVAAVNAAYRAAIAREKKSALLRFVRTKTQWSAKQAA